MLTLVKPVQKIEWGRSPRRRALPYKGYGAQQRRGA